MADDPRPWEPSEPLKVSRHEQVAVKAAAGVDMIDAIQSIYRHRSRDQSRAVGTTLRRRADFPARLRWLQSEIAKQTVRDSALTLEWCQKQQVEILQACTKLVPVVDRHGIPKQDADGNALTKMQDVTGANSALQSLFRLLGAFNDRMMLVTEEQEAVSRMSPGDQKAYFEEKLRELGIGLGSAGDRTDAEAGEPVASEPVRTLQ